MLAPPGSCKRLRVVLGRDPGLEPKLVTNNFGLDLLATSLVCLSVNSPSDLVDLNEKPPTSPKVAVSEPADAGLFAPVPIHDLLTPREERQAKQVEQTPTPAGKPIGLADDLTLVVGDAFDTSGKRSADTTPINTSEAVGPSAKDATPLAPNAPPAGNAGPSATAPPEFPAATPSASLSSSPPPPAGSGSMSMSSNVVISEVFAGGAEGGPFASDFVELFNRGTSTVNINGWSVQYADAGSSNWWVTPLSGSIAPGQRLLVKMAGNGPGAALPTPDVVGYAEMNAQAGKVALVQHPMPLYGSPIGDPMVVDFVGYGNADAFEGSAPAPSPGVGQSLHRVLGGTQDTNQNANDFELGVPTPQGAGGGGGSTLPVVSITASDAEAAEGTDTGTFTITRDSGVGTLTVQFGMASPPGTATEGADFSLTPSASVFFADGETSKTVTLTAQNDTLDEIDETAVAQLTTSSAYTITPGAGSATVTIHDMTDPMVSVAWQMDGYEGAMPVGFTVSRNGTEGELTVWYSLSGTATEGEDYVSPGEYVVIPDGQSAVTVSFATLEDAWGEGTETVRVSLDGGLYDINAQMSVATMSLYDNDMPGTGGNAPPTAVADVAGMESDDGYTLIDVLHNDTDVDGGELMVTAVNGATHGTLAIAQDEHGHGHLIHYTLTTAGFVGTDMFNYTIYDGRGGYSSASVSLTVGPINDAPLNLMPEAQRIGTNGTLTFSSTPENAIWIHDEDAATSPVSVTLAASVGTLSLSGTTGLTFTAGDGTSDTTMTFAGTLTAINTALDGLTFTAPSNTGDAVITVTTNDGGNTGSGGALTDTDTLIVSVLPIISVTAGSDITEEGSSPGVFTLHRSGGLTQTLTVSYLLGGTATAGADYVTPSGTATFAAGAATTTVLIQQIDDAFDEGAFETVVLGVMVEPRNIFESIGNAAIKIVKDVGDAVQESKRLGLDVDRDTEADDPGDSFADFRPGYHFTPTLSLEAILSRQPYRNHEYSPQKLHLVMQGYGTDNDKVHSVYFEITQVTALAGYASNATHPSILDSKKDDDYSFSETQDRLGRLITRNVSEGGKMEADRTWVELWCKDYGGVARITVTTYFTDNTSKTAYAVLPIDGDMDGMADVWERDMLQRWGVQYHGDDQTTWPAELSNIETLKPGDDKEKADPDGAGPQPAQKEEGDAHTVFEEYRGYILDGGGFDGQGKNGHKPGHIRLDPGRKEVLVEVDRNANVVDRVKARYGRNTSLSVLLDDASKVFSKTGDGAGVAVYFLLDKHDLEITSQQLKLGGVDGLLDLFEETRKNPVLGVELSTDFVHLVVVDAGVNQIREKHKVSAATADRTDPMRSLDRRGIIIAVDDSADIWAGKVSSARQAFSITVAHELTHMLIEKRDGIFNDEEHTTDPNGNGKENKLGDTATDPEDWNELMYRQSGEQNRSLSTVRIFPLVAAEFKIRTNQGLNP